MKNVVLVTTKLLLEIGIKYTFSSVHIHSHKQRKVESEARRVAFSQVESEVFFYS